MTKLLGCFQDIQVSLCPGSVMCGGYYGVTICFASYLCCCRLFLVNFLVHVINRSRRLASTSFMSSSQDTIDTDVYTAWSLIIIWFMLRVSDAHAVLILASG
jgi:hypothetical protein